jgi:hypothetical protein
MSGAQARWWRKNPDFAVAKRFKKGGLEEICSLDFHFKEVKSRFKNLRL